MKKIVLLVFTALTLCLSASAQNQRITGTVTDDEGHPIAGATIVVQGTTIGVISANDGSYAISNVPANAILIFQILGYETQEIPVGSRTVINVQLIPDVKSIDNVIVIGYGTSTRSSFTGSASVLDGAKIAERQVSNITNALAGQTAGVQAITTTGQPGSESSIRIRGVGSMSSSNNPLYVVDGVPWQGNISAINPNDIESVSVLKDASASAIYGARGANGVILVTTKKGRGQEAMVTVNARWGSSKPGVPNYNVITDPAMYYETYYRAMYNSVLYAGGSDADGHDYARNFLTANTNKGLGYNIYTVPEGEALVGSNFKLNPNATLGRVLYDSEGNAVNYLINDDWYDEVFSKGNLRQEYNVSVSGATDKMNYFLSAGYLDDNGVIDNSGFERYTARLNADYQAKKWLKLSASMGYTNYNNQSPTSQNTWGSSGNIFSVVNNIAPIYPMYVRDGDGKIEYDQFGKKRYDFGNTVAGSSRPYVNSSNPAGSNILDSYKELADVINGKLSAAVDIIDGLQVSAMVGFNSSNRRNSILYNSFYGSTASMGGLVQLRHYRITSSDQQYLITYKKNWDKHHFDALAGYESYNYKYQYLYGRREKLYSGNIAELNDGIENQQAESYTNNHSLVSVLSRFQYDYDGKYFVSASYRRDASSRFHKDNRWGDFGSVGASWLINREDFFQDLNASWVDLLKVKVSYGVQGNEGLLYPNATQNYYPYLDQYNVDNSAGDFAVTMYYKGNKDITWESSYNLNAGVEFSLFQDRLNGSIDYFNRKTKDLLYNVPVPQVLGYATVPKNVGSIRNYGVEIDLNGDVIRTSNIAWNINANATTLKNKILDLDPTLRDNGVLGSTFIYRIGGSLYNAYLVDYAGVDPDSGKALYWKYNNDGTRVTTSVFNDAQKRDQGSTLAKVYGGFGTALRVYDFDISLQFSYQLGGKIYDVAYQDLMHNGDNAGYNWHADILKAWTNLGDLTSIPRLDVDESSYQVLSNRFLTSSDFLSLNNVTVGYTFPQRITNKLHISSLRIFAQADNVFVISARKGLDPRVSIGGIATHSSTNVSAGSHNYSILRTISGGLSITF